VRIRTVTASAPAVRLRPTFLVLGAQKSGTTALYHYLLAHEEAFCARIKEVNFFDNNYGLGTGWYLSHFPPVWKGIRVRRRLGCRPAIGEFSPSYVLDPRVPARVHRFDPSMKLVVLLRDPVERAYSHYLHEVRRGHESLAFQEAIERESERISEEFERMLLDPHYGSPSYRQFSYLARGRYREQLERWLAVFPRSQMLFVESGSFRTDTAARMRELCRFLGIPEPHGAVYAPIGLTKYVEPLAASTRLWLARYFEPYNLSLYELLGRDFGWTRPAEVDVVTSAAVRGAREESHS
jgi:hypothetical protein